MTSSSFATEKNSIKSRKVLWTGKEGASVRVCERENFLFFHLLMFRSPLSGGRMVGFSLLSVTRPLIYFLPFLDKWCPRCIDV